MRPEAAPGEAAMPRAKTSWSLEALASMLGWSSCSSCSADRRETARSRSMSPSATISTEVRIMADAFILALLVCSR